MINRRHLLLAGAALGLVGASPRRSYLKEHRRLTRKLTVYHDASTALMMRATLLTPAFRDAMAAERQRLLDPTPENQAAFVARMDQDAAAYHEVVFAADSAFDNASGFGPGDDRWNLRLTAEGKEEALLEVSRIADPTPLHASLYDQIDIWSELWIARFERTVSHPRSVELHVGSGYGHGSVVWEDVER